MGKSPKHTKDSYNLVEKKKKTQEQKMVQKWVEDVDRHLSKKNTQTANRQMKRYSTCYYQGNVNKNHSEITLHTCQNGYNQRDIK